VAGETPLAGPRSRRLGLLLLELSLPRKILHLLIGPLTVLAYATVERLAFHELAARGKRVCSHDPLLKDSLARRQAQAMGERAASLGTSAANVGAAGRSRL
jgi:hypothetical protein